MFGGSMTLSGTIDGDVVLFGGTLHVDSSAVINGDCVIVGGSFVADEGADVNCANPTGGLPGAPFVDNLTPPIPPVVIESDPVVRMPEPPSMIRTFFRDLGEAIGSTLTVGLFALLLASVFPQHLARVEDAIRQKPAASGTVGFLTGVAAMSLGAILTVISAVLVLVCVGVLGFPIVFAMGLLLAAGVIMGWVALGKMLGEWLTTRFNIQGSSPNSSAIMATVLGTMALTFVLTFLKAVPFVFGAELVIAVLASVGLGAAALTKMGTRAYPLAAAMPGNGAKINDVLATMPADDE